MSVRTLAVIQANHTDLLGADRDASHYVVDALRRSRRIERIVIAAPDVPANRPLADAAAAWGVDYFGGAELDVIDRIVGAARHVGARPDAVIARVLLNRFYLDAALVDRTIDLLRETGSDFVGLPYDFDINFGADVFTLDCLARAGRALQGPDRAHERFRPWLFIEEHPEVFRAITCEDVPTYGRDRLDAIRVSGLFAERDCMTYSTFTYEMIARELEPDDVVLDIACGTGEGTALLAPRCRRVVGGDLDAAAIEEARAAATAPNVSFEVQDGCALDFADGYFSAIVNSNTLEHVGDDEAMLRSFNRVLRPGGRLVLETPLLRHRPFKAPLLSSHVREYEKEPLLALIERCGFAVERKLGMNRGMYVDWSRAREAVLIHARRADA